MLFRHLALRASLIFLLSLVESQSNPENAGSDQHRKRRVSDPMSSFFSELGDLFLDVDKAIAVQSQPKLEHEANVASQLFRPRSDYFNRIQENYKEMQKRLGSLIGNTIGFRNSYSAHELTTVNPPENFSPTIDPDYNPFAAAEARKEKLKQKISKGSSSAHIKVEPKISIPKTIDESFKAFSKLSQAIEDIGEFSKKPSKSDDKTTVAQRSGHSSPTECSNEVLEDPDLEKRRQERCSRIEAEEHKDSRKSSLEPTRTTVLFRRSSDILDELSKGILGRSGDMLVEDLAEIPRNLETKASDEESECSDEVLEDAILEKERKERCNLLAAEKGFVRDLRKLLQDPKRVSEKLFPVDLKEVDLLSILRRSGDTAVDENLSNMLSDSSLDKQIRLLIKEHGSWLLDYPLLKRWRQRDRSSSDSESEVASTEAEHDASESSSDSIEIEPTELYLPVSTDYIALSKSGETAVSNSHPSSYYKIVNKDGDVIEEEVDFVLDPESLSNEIEDIEMKSYEPKETSILAFTSDGIPLKLSLKPEIENPIQYLHNALQSAGVSLNIPVESYDDLEPVGKEVLKLGSGILTRAVAINASNPNELKTLLKALMASKISGKTIF